MQRIESEVELEPRLSFIGDQLKVSFKIGITQKYVLKDLREFLNHVTTESNYRYGKKLEFLHPGGGLYGEGQSVACLYPKASA